MPKVRAGVVSVILVNFRGASDTITAIEHLRNLDWPSALLEIVVVENASGDDSAQRIHDAAPDVKLVVSKINSGFAGGSNLGVKASSGEFVAFLNNDARPDAGWIRHAVSKFTESATVGAVASKVLDWDGKLVDYIGSAMTWYGMGYKPHTAQPIPHGPDPAREVLFGTGAAMFVRRSVFDELGGFDERYFMFFEDVDLGWRLNLLGWRFVYEPKSLAFHKHHASMKAFGSHKETYLLERNALFTLYKNIGDESVDRALAGALALSVRRAVTRGKLDSSSFDLRKGGPDEETAVISRQTVAALFAIDQFVEELDTLSESRAQIQATRTVSDTRIWRLFGLADAPVIQDRPYLDGYNKIVDTFDVTEPPSTTKVLVITGDPIGRKLAGPAIRAWNIAEMLSRTNEVVLASMSSVESIQSPFDVIHLRAGDEYAFSKLERWADVILFQGNAMAVFNGLRDTTKIVVADIYDPMHLEQLEQGRDLPEDEWRLQVSNANDVLNQQIARADYFMCASDRQRLFWLGQLTSLGRVNPATYDGDPNLTDLIGVVPFGLSSTPPVHRRDVLKGVLPGIGPDDKVILWGGGLYNWFDPKTLIRAVAQLSERHDNVRLFFQGTKHPHPGVPEMDIVADSRWLAAELGVLGTSVFFNDSWVDYSDRENYLLEADAGVSTHFAHIETTFSFRTRILDYLWAELPMVVTAGDHFAELIEREKLGVVVDAEDVGQLAAGLEKVLFDRQFADQARKNIKRVRRSYFWEEALAPLTRFIDQAHHARDNQHFRLQGGSPAPRPRKRRKQAGFRHNLRMVGYYLRNGGPFVVAGKIVSKLSR